MPGCWWVVEPLHLLMGEVEFFSLRGELERTAGCVQHITQRRAELEISYAGCKVIVCIEGNRRPLCLRIRLAVNLPPGSWSSHSTLFHRIAVVQHDWREQGGFTALWVTLGNYFWNWNNVTNFFFPIELRLWSSWWSQLIVLMVLECNAV